MRARFILGTLFSIGLSAICLLYAPSAHAALLLNGVNQSASNNYCYVYSGAGTLTFSLWLQANSLNPDNMVMLCGDNGSIGISWYFNIHNGSVEFVSYDRGNNWIRFRTTSTITTGTPYFLTVAFDSMNINSTKLYINGVSQPYTTDGSGTYIGPMRYTLTPLSVGYTPPLPGSFFFNGVLEKLALYDSIPTDATVMNWYQNGTDPNGMALFNLATDGSDTNYLFDLALSGNPQFVQSIIPSNTPPSVNHLTGAQISPGGTYTESGTFTDEGSTSWSATVDYGDGSGQQALPLSGNTFLLNHSYASAGIYAVTVQVTDNQGTTGTRTAYVYSVAPNVNGALLLNGVNQEASNSHCAQYSSSNTLAVAFWINVLSSKVDNVIFQCGDPFPSWYVNLHDNRIELTAYDTGIDAIRFRTNTQLTLGTPHFVTIAFNGADPNAMKIYVNGLSQPWTKDQPQGGTAWSGTLKVGDPTFRIGHSPISYGYWVNGVFEKVAIYNTLPSDTDVADWYVNGSPQNGVAYFPLATDGTDTISGNTLSFDNNPAFVAPIDVNATPTPTPTPSPTTLSPTADTYVKQGGQNENEGASTFLRLQSTGHNRALLRFDESAIQQAVSGDPHFTATLNVTITENGNNWGTNGRSIEVHRLTKDWAEGNGFIDGNNPTNRGTGSGGTWNCANDTNISNQNDDCSGVTAWNMDNSSLWPFITTPSATTTITNNQTGTISIDVTLDIQSFLAGTNSNYGWIIKKSDEGANGRVQFGSKESSFNPTLIITPQ